MTEKSSPRKYDLEERTFRFSKRVNALSRMVPLDIANREIVRQKVKAAGSVGANYIEANEALSRKDFIYRIKICRKEAKESRFWLRQLRTTDPRAEDERQAQVQEASELTKIFGSIISRLE